MVMLLQWAIAAAFVMGSTAHCSRAKYEFTGTDALGCMAGPKHDKHLTEGHCHDSHRWNLLSYTVRQPHHPDRKANVKQNCRLVFYDGLNCKGYDSISPLIAGIIDTCQRVNFTTDSTYHGFRGAKSVKLICKPIEPAKPSKSTRVRTVALTEVVNVMPSPKPLTTTVWPSFVTSATPCCQTTTVVKPAPQSSVAASSSIVQTATVKQTTTIIAPPTATVQGKTTVWVASNSSKTVRERTYVVTMSDMAELPHKVRQAMDEEESSSASATPTLVVRAEPNSTECYASVDGQWVVSTCAAPTATQKVKRAACTGHKREACYGAL